MAHFRGTIKGTRGEASRLGSPKSGLRVVANGWNFGVKVYLSRIGDDDVADIYLTGGSHDGEPHKYLGKFTARDLGVPNLLKAV